VLIPLIDAIYINGTQDGCAGMVLRAIVCAISLLPPTILMGASLPAIVRWAKSETRGASWWGLLYGANTVGAVAGCLVAGFYLLRVFDMATATFAAAAVNVAVALGSFALARRAPDYSAPDSAAASAPVITAEAWPIYVTIALS